MSGYSIAIAFMTIMLLTSCIGYIRGFPLARTKIAKLLYIIRSLLTLSLLVGILLQVINSMRDGDINFAFMVFLAWFFALGIILPFIDYALEKYNA